MKGEQSVSTLTRILKGEVVMRRVTEEEFLEKVSSVRYKACESSLEGHDALCFRASEPHDAPDPFPVLGAITYAGPKDAPERQWFLTSYFDFERD